MNQATLHVDTNLLALYDNSDLRLNAFFRNNGGVLTFKGSYNGSALLFSGLTTAEVFLIRAECYARLNESQSALRDINRLLRYRYDITTYEPFYASDNTEILTKVLNERRKELIFRGRRWADLRRFNTLDVSGILLRRSLNGVRYELQPDSRRYILPIPKTAVELGGYEQNPR